MSVFVGLQKAFDTINTNILLSKLKKYGIRGFVLELLKNYLRVLQQVVKVNSGCSKPKRLTSKYCRARSRDLYCLYYTSMMRLTFLTISKPLLFADDTPLTCLDDDGASLWIKCNEDLAKFHKLTIANKLSVNQSKNSCVLIRNCICNSNHPIKINDMPLQLESFIQFLGIFLDHKLKFSVHIIYVCQKVSEALEI